MFAIVWTLTNQEEPYIFRKVRNGKNVLAFCQNGGCPVEEKLKASSA